MSYKVKVEFPRTRAEPHEYRHQLYNIVKSELSTHSEYCLYIGSEEGPAGNFHNWVVGDLPVRDEEFLTFLKLRIGCPIEISDWPYY